MSNVRYLPITVDAGNPSETWIEEALCREVDPELFFPEKGESARPAQRICGQCSARTHCLRDALTSGDVDYGVRGGLTVRQRRVLLREQTHVAAATTTADEVAA